MSETKLKATTGECKFTLRVIAKQVLVSKIRGLLVAMND